MKKIANKVCLFLSNLMKMLSSLIYQKDKSIVLFGSWFGERFADNPRYLYQFLHENKDNLKLSHVVWVTRDESIERDLKKLGYEVYLIGSKESNNYHKKAGMHILCNSSASGKDKHPDIDIKLSYRTIRINLWHGVGVVKGVTEDSLEYKRLKENSPLMYAFKENLEKNKIYRLMLESKGGWGDHFFLSPTSWDTMQFERFKYIPSTRIIQATYPRICECTKLLPEEENVICLMREYKYIILYLPTFRKGDDAEKDCICIADKIYDILTANNVLWIQKAHSASQVTYKESNIEFNTLTLRSQFDINVIMPYIDILVTDYSSAASDARYFRKRILFYLPDYDNYKNGENGFTPEADELLYGPKYFTADEFRLGLQQVFQENMDYLDLEYERIRDKYWGGTMDMGQIWEKICEETGYF